MGKVIGIDLGTTNTAVAVVMEGRPRVLEDDKGYKVLPSCVSVKPDGRYIVGQSARNLVITDPTRTVYAVKRLMGRRFDSPEVTEARRRVGYAIQPAPDGGCQVVLGGETYTPVEICALVLQVAKGIAEKALHDTVDEAVITVPAYFNHQQRNSTLEAARLAGLRCERLLNEPTAAALAYGFRKEIERTVVVYDLGGGTFDVSVLHLSKGVYEVLSTSGDTYLGGEDFDFRIVDYLANHFQSDNAVDLRQDKTSLQRLKEAAERAKCELSFTDRTTVLVPKITERENLEVALSRLTLESLVKDLIERTVEVTRAAVQDAGLQLSQIEDVILVGGQTRMPRVREAISSLFQREPSRTVHPEEVVAIGAAVHAASLSDSNLGATVLLDVTPFDLGIDVAGGLFQPVITRNSHVPAVGTRTFATAHDNQESVKVTVRQGESRFSVENEFLGEFVMNGLTAAPRMQTKVDVQFRLDSNGILFITSSEQGTGERKKVTIRNYAQVAQGGGQAQVEVEGETSGAAQKSPIATAPAPEKAPKGGLGAIGFLDRIFGRGKKAGDRPTSQVAQPAAPPPLAEAPAPVFATYEDLPEMDAPEALPDDALFGEEADPPEDFGALVPLDEDVPAFPLDGSDEDDEGPEPLPVGLPASRGPDPYAHGGDDPFGIGGGDDEGDDSFAMPLDEEVGYGAEESWDRSLSAPLSLPEDELEPEPTPLPLTPPPAAASRPGPLTPDPFADEGEDTDLQRLRRRPPSGDRSARRKPARLKLAYRRADAMVVEYLDNLRRGGCFVKTEKPLPVGRECIIEVRSPGLREPLHIAGVVSWSSADQASLPPGQAEGMGIEYRLDEGGREEIVRVLEGLVG